MRKLLAASLLALTLTTAGLAGNIPNDRTGDPEPQPTPSGMVQEQDVNDAQSAEPMTTEVVVSLLQGILNLF